MTAASTEARDRRIIALALEGTPPRDIAVRVGETVSTIYGVLTRARARGTHVPHFATQPVGPGTGRATIKSIVGRPLIPEASLRNPEFGRPRAEKAATPAPAWTEADDDHVRELIGRGVPLTQIGARIRKPYRMVIAAAERLQLFEPRELGRIAS